MNFRTSLMTAIAVLGMALLIAPVGQAQTCDGSGSNFIDLDGDGFNDNAPDHDGDGIPNGLDEDWIKNPQDGTGYKNGQLGENGAQDPAMTPAMTKSQQFKRLQTWAGYIYRNRISAFGGSNGSGAGVCDGSGSGAAAGTGTGICDGTGPHGGGQRNGNGGK